MKIAVITVAGISSRFNEGISPEKKVLKCLYTEGDRTDTLLYNLMKKCSYADRIILVGGYKFSNLCSFYKEALSSEFPHVSLVENEHYSDFGSGYSLYLGLREAISYHPDEVLFVEGDLDVDNDSFQNVVNSEKSVITFTSAPIYSDKAVVLYQNGNGRFRYAFNSSHGLLSIDEPFSCILNSGQIWKFRDIKALDKANNDFFNTQKEGTNLGIIQRYFDSVKPEDAEVIRLKRWVNCNTRSDYLAIKNNWENEENENFTEKT